MFLPIVTYGQSDTTNKGVCVQCKSVYMYAVQQRLLLLDRDPGLLHWAKQLLHQLASSWHLALDVSICRLDLHAR